MSKQRARELIARETDAPEESRFQFMLALQLRDLERARALLPNLEEHLRLSFEIQLLALDGDLDRAATLARDSVPATPYTLARKAWVLAAAGEIHDARTALEIVTWLHASRMPHDLHAQAPNFWELAKVLHEIGPEHHARALRMAKGALAMFELGGGSLFERDREEIRDWLATHS